MLQDEIKKDYDAKNKEKMKKIYMTIFVLIVFIIWFMAGFKTFLYKGTLKRYIETINTGIDKKNAEMQESYDEAAFRLKGQTARESLLTPISYVYGRNRCQDEVNDSFFGQPILDSKCDGNYMSTKRGAKICILKIDPEYVTAYGNYFVVYVDLDCRAGKFKGDKYTKEGISKIDYYSRSDEYPDIHALVFEHKKGNHYIGLYPQKNDTRYKKSAKLLKIK